MSLLLDFKKHLKKYYNHTLHILIQLVLLCDFSLACILWRFVGQKCVDGKTGIQSVQGKIQVFTLLKLNEDSSKAYMPLPY